MKRISIAFMVLLVASGCATTAGNVTASDAEIQQLETSKWNAAQPGGRDGFMNLFAEDFVSVEYGSDVQGGVSGTGNTNTDPRFLHSSTSTRAPPAVPAMGQAGRTRPPISRP